MNWIAVPLLALLFALFPLTDTDIWWHLACAREWVVTWSPSRAGMVNIHEFFQQVMYAVYCIGGAPLLVVFKAVMWGGVFALFMRGRRIDVFRNPLPVALAAVILFVFRFQFEMRPVLFSLLFLGVYWNALPWLLPRLERRADLKVYAVAFAVLALQWVWCRFQGLYILGPLFAALCVLPVVAERMKRAGRVRAADAAFPTLFVLLLFAMPFLHGDGVSIFLYPFGLLDRLLGISPSAAAFASGIAENRSPFTILLAGENVLASALMVALAVFGAAYAVVKLVRSRENFVVLATLFVTSVMALSAERNFALFLPVFLSVFMPCFGQLPRFKKFCQLSSIVILAFLLGFWGRSVSAYDSWVSYQRVPVSAAAWMKEHPHPGRLFNDDRAGGYLAFVNPADSIYIDGRFILKTAEFFERYMRYSEEPVLFLSDADSLGIDRAVFPLRFYARWESLLEGLRESTKWAVAYVDGNFIVFARK
ncbi:MAG: hypothetical protein IK012_11280 [Fibrobacter sp.]|uniref:hypothetical protein n=1 Tax=Fibrobacter sp. TaxID=35828 RepID=UPI0025C62825|nr:hypothetical protein [Fibrobacter sp.]MBR4785813.1 hypothetical protein [Fibrobacter sp.]